MINSDRLSTTDSDTGTAPATESVVEETKADLKPVDQSSYPVNESEQGSEADETNREGSFTRRALLVKAGWTVPVILAVGLPSTVLAHVTSPGRHHDKPKGHFDWPKKNHRPDTGKKSHWPDTGKKSHWPDTDKKKHWPDIGEKKHSHHYDRLWW